MLLRKLGVAVSFIWLGMVLAISFMEAPLKFQAPNVTLEIGLGIGRLVFKALNIIELIFLFILILSIFEGKKFDRTLGRLYFGLFFVLVAQSSWLLPILDARAIMIISGQKVEPSYAHLTYVVLEICKVFLLIAFGVVSMKRLAESASDSSGLK
ncbi:MAG: hypothetical protein KatS3mg006_2101 [Pyrinomonadaceae bacterium]|jgi:hypothetical protein|nr:MAG: hypothetical protein KatS3mg006_2101 [Pyrinomonadaceae bacterium]